MEIKTLTHEQHCLIIAAVHSYSDAAIQLSEKNREYDTKKADELKREAALLDDAYQKLLGVYEWKVEEE